MRSAKITFFGRSMNRPRYKKIWKILNVPSGKAAQMEIIGLVVIVILITLGMLFLAKFALSNKPKSTVVLRKGLAASTIYAILETTVENNACEGDVKPQLKMVLEDCAENFGGGSYSLYSCGLDPNQRKHSCNFFKDISELLLQQTLGAQARNYEFSSKLLRRNDDPLDPNDDVEILFDTIKSNLRGCPKTSTRDSSGSFPLPTENAGLIENVLFICD